MTPPLPPARHPRLQLSKPRKPSQRHDSVVRVGGLPCGVAPADVLQLFRWNWHANAASAVVRDAAGDGGTHAEVGGPWGSGGGRDGAVVRRGSIA